MTYTNYTRGVNKEYQAMKELRALNYFCSRSSGSHSCVDCFAIGADIKLIQVKRSKKMLTKGFIDGVYDKDIQALRDLTIPADSKVSKELWCWIDKKGWIKFKILENELKQL